MIGKKPLYSFVGCSLILGSLAFHPINAEADEITAESSAAGMIESAPVRRITGTVLDENSNALIGAAVVYGEGKGVITDFDGKFEISDIEDGQVITVSYVGYKDYKVTVKGDASLLIRLEQDTQTLDDVVVIGYGVQKKSNVTGSISSIKSEDFQNRVSSNAAEALQGKVSGVQVINNSGAPGASPTIRVRGFSSNGDSDPLYIVDGLKVESLEFLEPTNIESMEVLKDAASAAIYGAEAGNGVVLITTKSGKKGRTKVTFDAQFTWSHLAKKVDMMNAEQFIEYKSEAESGWSNYLTIYEYDGVTDTDWQEVMYETGKMQKYNLGISGGSDTANFLVSLGYMDNDGILVSNKDSFKRFTIQLNGTYQVKPWLEVGTTNSLAFNNSKTLSESNLQYGFMSTLVGTDPLMPTEYTGTLPSFVQTAIDNGHVLLTNPATGNYYGVSFLGTANDNPLAVLQATNDTNKSFFINGMTFANIKPFKGFVFTTRLGYRFSNASANSYTPEYWSDVTTYGDEPSEYPVLTSSQTTNRYYQWENFINYTLETESLGDWSLMAGMSYIDHETEYLYAYTNDLSTDASNFAYMDYSSTSADDLISGYTNKQRQIAYFGRFTWSYLNRYNFQVNFRADAYDSAYLAASNRWGYFPSVSAGWTVSNESFWEGVRDVVSYLKIRASWGKNGSISNLGSYMYAATLTSGATTYSAYTLASNAYYMDGTLYNAKYPTQYLANEDLKWETSKQVDLGIDFRMFSDRLAFSFDYFNKNTDGLLVATTPALATGATSVYKNIGNVNNHGYEFELTWSDRIGKDFAYSIKANISTLKNKVTEFQGEGVRLSGGTLTNGSAGNNPISYFEEGYPIWYLYGYKYLGVDDEGNEIIDDLDGDGEITDADRTYLGKGIPDFNYGITLSASYKGFDLNIYGAGSQGAELYYAVQGRSQNKLASSYLNRWTESTASTATLPSATRQIYSLEYNYSDAFVYDASFFKIKQIQLGYSFPEKWLKKASISSARLFVSLDNFFTFTSYPGSDPETRASSTNNDDANSYLAIDAGGYPIAKSVSFGFNIAF